MGTRANIWSMRVVHVALSIGLVIAALVAVRAQQAARVPRSAPATPLTAQDYLDIQALANRYAYGLDTGAENGTGSVYASVFAEDAEFHGPPAVRGGQPFDAAGREALRKFAVPGRGSAYVRHFMSNHLIEASPEVKPFLGRVSPQVSDAIRKNEPVRALHTITRRLTLVHVVPKSVVLNTYGL